MVIRKVSNKTGIEQIMVALLFAYLGLLFAGGAEIYTWVWVTLSLLTVKSASMIFINIFRTVINSKSNNNIHISINKKKDLKIGQWLLGILLSSLHILSCYMLNELCYYLSFAVIVLIFFYPFLKRITSISFSSMSIVEALAPIFGYLGKTGRFESIPFILGASVLLWIIGLKMVYVAKENNNDNRGILFSITTRFGKDTALLFSWFSYFFALSALVAAGIVTSRGLSYWISLVCIAIIFLRQQGLARGRDVEGAAIEFLQINSFISPLLFIGTFIDVMFI